MAGVKAAAVDMLVWLTCAFIMWWERARERMERFALNGCFVRWVELTLDGSTRGRSSDPGLLRLLALCVLRALFGAERARTLLHARPVAGAADAPGEWGVLGRAAGDWRETLALRAPLPERVSAALEGGCIMRLRLPDMPDLAPGLRCLRVAAPRDRPTLDPPLLLLARLAALRCGVPPDACVADMPADVAVIDSGRNPPIRLLRVGLADPCSALVAPATQGT